MWDGLAVVILLTEPNAPKLLTLYRELRSGELRFSSSAEGDVLSDCIY
jgi:hypothetical protein